MIDPSNKPLGDDAVRLLGELRSRFNSGGAAWLGWHPCAGQKRQAERNGDDKKKDDKDKEEAFKLVPKGWNLHAQTTIIDDFQPGFGALYSGPNSLGTARDREGTITADLFLGARYGRVPSFTPIC